jgi:hypothetical protein
MICRRIARFALRLSVRLIHQAAKYQPVRVDDLRLVSTAWQPGIVLGGILSDRYLRRVGCHRALVFRPHLLNATSSPTCRPSFVYGLLHKCVMGSQEYSGAGWTAFSAPRLQERLGNFMSTYIARWPNGDFTIVTGTNRLLIDEVLDEVGDPGCVELTRLNHAVAVHFKLLDEAPDHPEAMTQCFAFDGFDERSLVELWTAYPDLDAAFDDCEEEVTTATG